MNEFNGGYAVIDCKGINLLSQDIPPVEGIYEAVKTAHTQNKPIWAVNCKWGDKPITPIPIFAIYDVSEPAYSYTCTSSTLQIIVDKNDNITVVNMIGG